MKKRTKLITAAVSLGALMTVGGTLAWFTDSETATNTVTTGYVDVKIVEHKPENNDKYGYTYTLEEDNTGIQYSDITPGVEIEKDPTIVYTGSVPGYVRYKVEVEDENGTANDLIHSLQFMKNGNPVDQSELVGDGDGSWIYDTKAYEKDAEVANLFDTVKISDEIGNEIANKSIKIVVKADAIQAANLPGSEDGVNAEELAEAFGAGEVAVYNNDAEVE